MNTTNPIIVVNSPDCIPHTRPHGVRWWWVPTFVPLAGAICGAYFYVLCIEMHHPKDNQEKYQRITNDSLKNESLGEFWLFPIFFLFTVHRAQSHTIILGVVVVVHGDFRG